MHRWSALIVSLSLLVLLAACAANTGDQSFGMGTGMRMDPGMMQRHMAPIPAGYADRTNPIAPDAESLARGKTIYEANCRVCHGDTGQGDGPAATNLDPPPAPIVHTAQMLSDAYLFYRISEGGDFAPFNSAMPMWKDKLNESERWDVINYIRSLGSSSMMGGGGVMMDGGMMGSGVWWMMAPWWFLGWVVLISVIVAVVLVAIWAVRRSGRSTKPDEMPLEILKRRYAQGEITSEQFEMMKRQLSEK